MEKRNVSVAAINGYSLEKVKKAKEYLNEIGSNRRNFPIEKLVQYYNDIKGTKESAVGCKACAANKFYNGIANYYEYGRLTLIANGKATEADFEVNKVEVEEPKPIENAENRIVLEDKAEEEKPKKTKGKKQDNDKD